VKIDRIGWHLLALLRHLCIASGFEEDEMKFLKTDLADVWSNLGLCG